MFLFWGCFVALITTAFAFSTRTYLINTPEMWPAAFSLDAVQSQELFGAGIWPFAISIIVFSLVIDKIGYKTSMVFSFVCYAAYTLLAFMAHSAVAGGAEGEAAAAAQKQAYSYLYWGSIILGLGNGTVEAFINPVVATMFNKEKTKWLNILHAGWPGGLVLGGLLTILIGPDAIADDWRILVALIAIPAVVFLIMLIKANFPVNERVASGTTYKEMLAEFGALGAFLACFMIFGELAGVFKWGTAVKWGLISAATIAYGIYCKSVGRPILIILCLVMMPLATTELGTDGAITGIMGGVMENPLYILIYTSALMAVLRFFFAGPIVQKLTPIGLLIASSAFAIAGLFFLSTSTTAVMIFVFATLYGFGKTFFWPTMLGVVSEQCPKGGALTLNAIAGIGMLTVGIIALPLIGKMQEDSVASKIQKETYDSISKESEYFLGKYTAVDPDKLNALDADKKKTLEDEIAGAKQGALSKMTVFPFIMLLAYIGLFLYFRSKGGYKTIELGEGGGGAAH